MYLEVVDCLNVLNKSVYGMPVISTIIAENVGRLFYTFYYHILFTVPTIIDEEVISLTMDLSIRIFEVILLYGIGQATAQEINRMSLVLHQRSLMERNPRIRRQIKFFILRRYHEPYRFVLCGICEINMRKLFLLLNKAVAYLIIQTLFKLNRNTGRDNYLIHS
ncbi:uncharacterized protein LOC111031894 [Myzus persicae]|uniref:uncharacterized protein LOC111031894 n=1 Tax=Myzus persicae TaxID=13164 RepID=UPI000B934115|nr:uncharacterized protein LOC111031894 [Myzus persicae]